MLSLQQEIEEKRNLTNQLEEAKTELQAAANLFISDFNEKFEPIKFLGGGTYGSVFKVKNKLDRWEYAVKRIPVRGREADRIYALKEAKLMASFVHTSIVVYKHCWMEQPPINWQRKFDDKMLMEINCDEFFNYRNDSAFLYIQMELCQSSLYQWLTENQTRDLLLAKVWFKQLVSAVEYIHSREKIHRDLKPQNILLAGDDRLKICDLGIMSDLTHMEVDGVQELSMERTYAQGTPMYMAPEQMGSPVYTSYTSKVDIFALGLILTQLSTVLTKSEACKVFNEYRDEIPSTVLDHLPETKAIVAWLTRKKSSERPTCEEILQHTFFA
ncbi:hypothetical protein PENTCL1PPCAC_8771 [Pristionchus entomophagus]|uniref:Protein kinase domain-containing protein n=1 Tax=Pristionchus entomophagus TaxID=358040 RepID=A0AAV5STY1_9BILA|nr:hypothetical protein PENTCL1PPCAC_8771 [Pristionchus entomophagus]